MSTTINDYYLLLYGNIDEIIELFFINTHFFVGILLFVIFGEICVWQTFLIRDY